MVSIDREFHTFNFLHLSFYNFQIYGSIFAKLHSRHFYNIFFNSVDKKVTGYGIKFSGLGGLIGLITFIGLITD